MGEVTLLTLEVDGQLRAQVHESFLAVFVGLDNLSVEHSDLLGVVARLIVEVNGQLRAQAHESFLTVFLDLHNLSVELLDL